MINDDKKIEESKRLIEKEIGSGNVLATALNSILSGANSEVKKKHHLVLYDLMQVGNHISKLMEVHNDKNN